MTDIKEKIKGTPENDDNNVISSGSADRVGGQKKSAMSLNENGVLISGKAEKDNKKEPAPAKKTEDVAIYSSKNVTWQGVGSVSKGYNIVSKAEAAKWQGRSHIRPATPEEVAAHYGK